MGSYSAYECFQGCLLSEPRCASSQLKARMPLDARMPIYIRDSKHAPGCGGAQCM